MIKLKLSLQEWKSDSFIETLKLEICSLEEKLLPLQQGLRNSSIANAENLSVTILKVTEDDSYILAKVGLFYTGIIAGCNCADDPAPVDEITEYCEALFTIDKTSAEASITLID
jgi:hypothetical protein